MTLHLVGFPHSQTVRGTACPFTSKLVRFAEMMGGLDITVYSGERNEAPCQQHVACFTDREQREWFGDQSTPNSASFDPGALPWLTMNARVAAQIQKRAEPHDLVLILGGNAQRSIADALPHLLTCEWGCGYEGIFTPYVAFESQAWRHYLYGRLGSDGRFFDAVIPNFFRPEDFRTAASKEDYLLFVGRLVQRKGVHTAAEIAKACGRKLLLAGTNVKEAARGRIVCDELTLEGDHLEYIGAVSDSERNELMGKAAAVLVPTSYVEPFGAVAVEAQLCGTPAVTTDWGAFTETVDPQYRFSNLEEALAAVERAVGADPLETRETALSRFSLGAVEPLYDRWFSQLESLWADGWYEREAA